MLEPSYERVHTVTDYCDGPRKGIADFEGRPHFYESEWDDFTDDNAVTFRLAPVETHLLELALESWNIWQRWKTAFDQGRTTLATHPALPDDLKRSDELRQILDRELKINEGNYIRAQADFKACDDLEWNGVGWRPLQVKWTRL